MIPLIVLIAFTADFASVWIASIFRLISSVAAAVCLASSLTSLATTAKPAPTSPARAASTVAFSANKSVFWAIDVMVLITWPISALDSPSLETMALVSLAVTANETNAIVSKLGESSAEIGQVIKTITSIAQKTDLLALNATVEAARAGEVGAGFAVVANEVKELAKQTAAATEDISRKIEAIQTDAKSAVNAISTISGIISQVNQISATIAAAVEEQSATTSEMSRNLTDAAKGAGEVAQNINGVAQAAQNTSHGAADSLKAAQQLAKMSTQLRGLVEQFKLDRTHVRRARSRRDPNVDLDTHTVGEREYEETGVR